MDFTRYFFNDREKPLDFLKSDGGFTRIFSTIACIGDSLSSGELESYDQENGTGYHDFYDYSWGQFISRACGNKVFNFSRGGMTAREYIGDWGDENDVWNREKASQAYIIALGHNDLFGMKQHIGSVDDITLTDNGNCPVSFAADYGEIIMKYKAIQPDAKFFLVTMPRSIFDDPYIADLKRAHQNLLVEISQRFENIFVIDLWKDGPVIDAKLRKSFFVGGHLNVMGYCFSADIIMTYIDYIIRRNVDCFLQTGFIGTPWKNTNYKF